MPGTTRNTRQKEAIRLSFSAADRPLSHDEALTLAQAEVDGLSLATVYRNIRQLVEDGWLIAVEVPGAPTRYEVAGKAHHHHFQCNRCGRLYELEGCAVEVKPKLPRGFRGTGHELFVFGLCAGCV
jgi:Fur family ferric uptake transcriptional regulator